MNKVDYAPCREAGEHLSQQRHARADCPESAMTESEAHDAYDEYLDCEGPITVAGCEYMPSRILKEVDPTAYRCGFADWADAEGIDTDELED